MEIKKLTAAALAAATSAALPAAVPEVSGVTMEQSATRRVTITYTLADAPAVVTLDVQTNANTSAAADDPGWTSIGGEAVWNAQGDVWKKVETGSHTITWRPDHSWPDHKIAAGGARAVVTAWALDNTPDYMAVDITATGGADTQTYYPAADFVPGGVTNADYKTSVLLMRKIMAKGVTWTMGSVAETNRVAANEETHRVALTNNYYIGVYPVTQTQWQQVTGYNPSYFTADQTMRPVENVSYMDIRQGKGTASTAASATGGVYPADPYGDSFLGLLRKKTGIDDFDLPSEAQWEFAARAGNGEGHWGDGSVMAMQDTGTDSNLNRLGRYLNNPSSNSTNSPAASIAPSVGGTAIVGSYAPNAWGIYDMHGNVWEWCLDWYAADIAALNGAVNTVSSVPRILRSGSWRGMAWFGRPAYRGTHGKPIDRSWDNGFRVVCTAGLR